MTGMVYFIFWDYFHLPHVGLSMAQDNMKNIEEQFVDQVHLDLNKCKKWNVLLTKREIGGNLYMSAFV